ncbi:EfeM/EfeO family lipoprotein [Virgibacillus phasianinus]|uniref:EfeM/EfeO family lipoprotein n=1 Tax=Virgibacillus phasianinus TaxID=2017483 RepID=A0A220U3X0_9BACI|nr:iron uptake system protein EfeO [Virgibacillus phasianinus]ASK62682.1 EfeM/EfeO family lipoprotein [Virgibacillus phasianinus]
MQFKKTVGLLLSLTLLITMLAACGENNTKSDKINEESVASETDSVKELAKDLQKINANLQAAAKENKQDEVKKIGEKLNDQWLTTENKIRDAYPLLYTDVEKYLLPLYTEVTTDSMDQNKVIELAGSLQDSLGKLENAKETAMKSSELLDKAVKNYREYVNDQTEQLVATTKEFTDAVKAGKIEKAKELYADARVFYERIEPIAESFGDLDPKIDARETDVEPADWSGFHRIEKALWKDKSLEGMDKVADQLNKDVLALQEKVKQVDLSPTQVVAGSMELLNEAAISKITGEEERYSHIDLVDFAANVEGSQAVYHAIIPALQEKDSKLADQLDKQFIALMDTLNQYKKNGEYVLYTELTDEQIRDLSSKLSVLSEKMAQTAAIFQ